MNQRTALPTVVLLCTVLLFLSTIGRAEDAMDGAATTPETTASTNNKAAGEAGPSSIITVPDSARDTDIAPGSAEIPVTRAQNSQSSAADGASVPPTPNNGDGNPAVNYERAQNLPPYDAGEAEQLMMEDESDLPLLGVDVRLDQRKLKSGESISGLLVVAVEPGGPAAIAGLKGSQHKLASAVETVVMAAAMIFPPAAPVAMLAPMLGSSHIGEHYDLIDAIDGNRVTNLVDLQDAVRDARPGETMYLSIIRDGMRLQVPVKLPRQSPVSRYPW